MRGVLRRIYRLMVLFGVDPLKTVSTVMGLRSYFRDLRQFRKQEKAMVCAFKAGELRPCLQERFLESGTARGHYFHQDLLVARRIYVNNPKHHVDVGSRMDGFVAHVAVFRPITAIDIRPQANTIPNITFIRADVMQEIRPELIGFCDSLSCLHAAEHFGLGRYGDPVRADGHQLGLNGLHKMLIPGGKLYLSVPVGPQRIEFNAHRVFSIEYLLKLVAEQYSVDNASIVDDAGDLHENVPVSEVWAADNGGCFFGCCILEMTKVR